METGELYRSRVDLPIFRDLIVRSTLAPDALFQRKTFEAIIPCFQRIEVTMYIHVGCPFMPILHEPKTVWQPVSGTVARSF